MISFVTATVQILPGNQIPSLMQGSLGEAVLKHRTLPVARAESYRFLTAFFLFFNLELQSVLEHAEFIISSLRAERSEAFRDIRIPEFGFCHCWLP